MLISEGLFKDSVSTLTSTYSHFTVVWQIFIEFSTRTSAFNFSSCLTFFLSNYSLEIHFCLEILTDDDAINVVYLKKNTLPKATFRSCDFYDADFYFRYEIVNGLLWRNDINSVIKFHMISKVVIKMIQCLQTKIANYMKWKYARRFLEYVYNVYECVVFSKNS